MKANVGTEDRVARIAIGLVLLSTVLFADGAARWWGLIGLAPLLTALFSYCPLYSLLGVDTRLI